MTDERCQSNLNAFGNARVSFGHANRDVPLGCLHCVSEHSEYPCVTVRVVCVQVAHNETLLLRFMSVTKLHPFTVTPRSFRVRLREVRKFRMQDARCADQTDGRCLARCDDAECGVVGIIGGSQEIGERALQVRPTPLLLVLRLCTQLASRRRRSSPQISSEIRDGTRSMSLCLIHRSVMVVLRIDTSKSEVGDRP